ncbi:hypothetical protein [Streptomyces sp. NBC_01180]|uniref:hypothetical protein n=1 Tax=Streptomyces sp. NBC_01180 TaxID=2903763 RepID=UPI0038700A2B|nr:hypothetical protein OG708_17750 [Streptomyces sp. NBC_01180]
MSTPAAPAADAGDTAPDATVPGTGQNPAPNPAAPDAPAVPAVAGSEDVSSLPQWAQKQLTDARAEAAKSRTVAKQNAAQEATAEITQRLAEALGITPTTDTPPDPAALTAQVAELSAQLRTAQVQNAARAAAADQQARPDRLLNSVAFNAKIADLDPAAADFGEQLKAAITAEIATDPELYRSAPAGPARAGAEFSGPPSDGVTPAQFAGMDYAARAALFQTDPIAYRRLAGTQ